jgi:hypothetical protein
MNKDLLHVVITISDSSKTYNRVPYSMQHATLSLTDSEVKWLINSLLNLFTLKPWALISNYTQTERPAFHKSVSLKPQSRGLMRVLRTMADITGTDVCLVV